MGEGKSVGQNRACSRAVPCFSVSVKISCVWCVCACARACVRAYVHRVRRVRRVRLSLEAHESRRRNDSSRENGRGDALFSLVRVGLSFF